MAKKPDPPTDGETVPKKRKISAVMVWVLMAPLIVGLGGFGVTNFGGGTARIATVGDRPIEVTEYARALQQELQAFSAQLGQPVTMEMAQTLGLDSQVRRRLITAAALDNEASRIGLSVGDARVAQEIMANDARGPCCRGRSRAASWPRPPWCRRCRPGSVRRAASPCCA
jgi:peptidyl-prolyl cis-trans isomerase D